MFKELLNKELQVMDGVHAVSGCDVIVHEFGGGQAIISVNTESVQTIITVIPFIGARVLNAASPFVPYTFQ